MKDPTNCILLNNVTGIEMATMKKKKLKLKGFFFHGRIKNLRKLTTFWAPNKNIATHILNTSEL